MKVIKEANPDKFKPEVTFECTNCECIYIAEKGEFKVSYYQDGELAFYSSYCPICGTYNVEGLE